MRKKADIEALIADILDGTELDLRVDSYRVQDDLESGEVTITCDVHDARSGDRHVIEGAGVGIVDAFFHGMVSRYSGDYPSLKTIRFVDFSIRAEIEKSREQTRQGADSTADVTLRVANSEDHEFVFTDRSPSMARSSVRVVLSAAAFFINSERAFSQVYRALQHAKAENRSDSVQRYTAQMTTLVEATSYSEVIDAIKNEALD